MSDLKFLKVTNNLPPFLEANAVYLVKQGTEVRGYVTDSSGTPVAYEITPDLTQYAMSVHTHQNVTRTHSGFMSADDKVIVDRLHATNIINNILSTATIHSNFKTGLHRIYGSMSGTFKNVPAIQMYDYPNSNCMMIPDNYGQLVSVRPFDLPIESGRGLKLPIMDKQLFTNSWDVQFGPSWDRTNISLNSTPLEVGPSYVPAFTQRGGVTGRHFVSDASTRNVAVGDRFTVNFFTNKSSTGILQVVPMYNTGSQSYINIIHTPNAPCSIGGSTGDIVATIKEYNNFNRITITLPTCTQAGTSGICEFAILSSDSSRGHVETGNTSKFVYLSGISCVNGSHMPSVPAHFLHGSGTLQDLSGNVKCTLNKNITLNHFMWTDATIFLTVKVNHNRSVANDRAKLLEVSFGDTSTANVQTMYIAIDNLHVYAKGFVGPELTSSDFDADAIGSNGGTLNIAFTYGRQLKLSVNGNTVPGFVHTTADLETHQHGVLGYNRINGFGPSNFVLGSSNMVDMHIEQLAVVPVLSESEHVILSGVIE